MKKHIGFILIMLTASAWVCMPPEKKLPDETTTRTALLYSLPVNFINNFNTFAAMQAIENTIVTTPGVRLFYSNELNQNSLLIVLDGKPKDRRATVQNLVNGPMSAIVNRREIFDFTVLRNLATLDGNEKKVVLEFYRKKPSFNSKTLHAKLHLMTRETAGYEEFGLENSKEVLAADTMLFRQAHRKYDYARLIGFTASWPYSEAVLMGLYRYTNREAQKTTVVFEGRRIDAPNILEKIR